MFTGLVEGTARVESLSPLGDGHRLMLDFPIPSHEIQLGESIAINGCCLTVTEIQACKDESSSYQSRLAFDLLNQTLEVTNLGDLIPDHLVNFERALRLGDRLGGHWLQGHIDHTGIVLKAELIAESPESDLELLIEIPPSHQGYVMERGSLAVNGVSLTIADLHNMGQGGVRHWIIPHTRAITTLGNLKPGDRVNLEYDLLAKYVERLLAYRK